ncbi:hypothetical protein LPB72_17225 [Hydrogenophaga crassostreae]|uniref:DUF1697 domain-containing protein n=1 Tax=Hydrogenophaga crassostreae TaxID=1763535 RepID=A0A167GVL3_9BURK|nr:DUF1697 domain-containing protein [Hydrogenophaga crassostreae]AOW12746.1 hypothetical protein LPB072_07730 [Hydrogenophaga crassostreae]OAD39935.1 hypothetical protein LPB72_17225 [Hydrogenophaga crassostreae]
MARYAAFLRGVSPMNARMPALRHCFEKAGFTEVRTLLSSGNLVFNARAQSLAGLQRRAEEAMQSELGRTFSVFVRPTEHLQHLIEPNPFLAFDLEPMAKPVVTFLGSFADPGFDLPIESEGASILKLTESEVLSAYVPNPKGPLFMNLLERCFGKNITTRTLETVRKCAWA